MASRASASCNSRSGEPSSLTGCALAAALPVLCSISGLRATIHRCHVSWARCVWACARSTVCIHPEGGSPVTRLPRCPPTLPYPACVTRGNGSRVPVGRCFSGSLPVLFVQRLCLWEGQGWARAAGPCSPCSSCREGRYWWSGPTPVVRPHTTVVRWTKAASAAEAREA